MLVLSDSPCGERLLGLCSHQMKDSMPEQKVLGGLMDQSSIVATAVAGLKSVQLLECISLSSAFQLSILVKINDESLPPKLKALLSI